MVVGGRALLQNLVTVTTREKGMRKTTHSPFFHPLSHSSYSHLPLPPFPPLPPRPSFLSPNFFPPRHTSWSVWWSRSVVFLSPVPDSTKPPTPDYHHDRKLNTSSDNMEAGNSLCLWLETVLYSHLSLEGERLLLLGSGTTLHLHLLLRAVHLLRSLQETGVPLSTRVGNYLLLRQMRQESYPSVALAEWSRPRVCPLGWSAWGTSLLMNLTSGIKCCRTWVGDQGQGWEQSPTASGLL